MELIIIIVAIIAIITIFFMMKTNVKELEQIALDKELNTISEKFPDNIEISKAILEKLKNKTTKINMKTCLIFIICNPPFNFFINLNNKKTQKT